MPSAQISPIVKMQAHKDALFSKRPFAQLCVHCQKVFDNWPVVVRTLQESKNGSVPSYRTEHLESLGELELSAVAGCNLCEQFFNSAKKIVYDSKQVAYFKRRKQLDITKCNYPHASEDWVFVLNVLSDEASPKGTDETSKGLCRAICSVTLYATSDQALVYEPKDRYSKSTRDSLSHAKQWLSSCLASHKTCSGLKHRHIPTRLLYLGGKYPCLSLASEMEEVSGYATLSHCWGSLPFSTLKKDNLDAFKRQIPREALTNTFNDAIYVAKHLGLNYLWIDSLCIVQDDDDDWRKEAALMSSVYRGSSINISASSAKNGTFGCFQKRGSSWRCQIRGSHGDESLLFDCVPISFQRSLLDSPLVSRGWVLQERVLSCRNLHFTQKEVFWECQERLACETFPEQLPECLDRSFRFLRRPLQNDNWGAIIQKYSACKLTYSRDKLIAMSGLARIVQEGNKDEYVAGMWRKDLETQLTWYAYTPLPRISPYVAPSWSWASSASSIGSSSLSDVPFGIQRKLATVQDVKIEYTSQDTFGEMKGASLRLRCQYFIRASIYQDDELWYLSAEFAQEQEDVYCRFDCLDTGNVESIEVYFLPIIKHLRNDTERYFGIMVEPTGERKGEYRRIGQFSWVEPAHSAVPTLIELCKNTKTQVDDSEYIGVFLGQGGIKEYIIDMI
ncbi:heterokaryon incompatibility protein-domain-containing protein [Tricladium varicosporioides]|nr:heterokaryon incompatibility protein-domain-containing protein [Hymenoscyphus varicosporioides]